MAESLAARKAGGTDGEAGSHDAAAPAVPPFDVVTSKHTAGTVHVVVQRCTRAKLLVSTKVLAVRGHA